MPVTLDDTSSLNVTDHLLAQSRISLGAADRARRLHEETGEELDVILTRLGFVTEADLASAYSKALDIECLEGDRLPSEPIAVDQLPCRYIRAARILPVRWEDREGDERSLVLAMANPLDKNTIATVSYAVGAPVICNAAPASDIEHAINRLYIDQDTLETTGVDEFKSASLTTQHSEDTERLRDLTSDAPIVRLVNKWLAEATEIGASDIHIEPSADALEIRLRVDGVLHAIDSQPKSIHPALVSRIKIMAKLDIGERRLPQDGRLDLAVRGQKVDVRVSILPAVGGESVVLRLLNRGAVALDFASLGIEGNQKDRFVEVLDKPHGILLVTGPTGSGKTTTLYASLQHIMDPSFKILTAEDPVEYRLDGVMQSQVQPQVGLTFASLLRSFLRHDPDIIMVGEIRDVETARIACQAALTGHLVLSTLHTNDAASAITRLMDMGLEDYLLTATINGIVGQRLLRRLCSACAQPYSPDSGLVERLNLRKLSGDAEPRLYKAVGCGNCNGTGYKGRMAVMEILPITPRIQTLIMHGATAADLRQAAVDHGMKTIFDAGLVRALAGDTSLEEVMRVAGAG